MRARTNFPSLAQRQVQAGVRKANSYQLNDGTVLVVGGPGYSSAVSAPELYDPCFGVSWGTIGTSL
jgi:hypothetical protein